MRGLLPRLTYLLGQSVVVRLTKPAGAMDRDHPKNGSLLPIHTHSSAMRRRGSHCILFQRLNSETALPSLTRCMFDYLLDQHSVSPPRDWAEVLSNDVSIHFRRRNCACGANPRGLASHGRSRRTPAFGLITGKPGRGARAKVDKRVS